MSRVSVDVILESGAAIRELAVAFEYPKEGEPKAVQEERQRMQEQIRAVGLFTVPKAGPGRFRIGYARFLALLWVHEPEAFPGVQSPAQLAREFHLNEGDLARSIRAVEGRGPGEGDSQ